MSRMPRAIASNWTRALRRAAVSAAAGALLAAQAVAPNAAQADPQTANVADFSTAKAAAINPEDIVTALAVPRGTKIQPNARPTVRLPIYFETGSAELKPEAKELLERVSTALASPDLKDFRFSVEGHTDAQGEEHYNDDLSVQRAASVKQFLAERGVPQDRLESVGHGEAEPVAPNDVEDGRRRNRRVEIINLGGGQ
jgi:OOP family OmpA-OmpF porin